MQSGIWEPLDHARLCCESASVRAQEAEIYARSLTTVNELEAAFGALWTQCQRCQGSLHQARPHVYQV